MWLQEEDITHSFNIRREHFLIADVLSCASSETEGQTVCWLIKMRVVIQCVGLTAFRLAYKLTLYKKKFKNKIVRIFGKLAYFPTNPYLEKL